MLQAFQETPLHTWHFIVEGLRHVRLQISDTPHKMFEVLLVAKFLKPHPLEICLFIFVFFSSRVPYFLSEEAKRIIWFQFLFFLKRKCHFRRRRESPPCSDSIRLNRQTLCEYFSVYSPNTGTRAGVIFTSWDGAGRTFFTNGAGVQKCVWRKPFSVGANGEVVERHAIRSRTLCFLHETGSRELVCKGLRDAALNEGRLRQLESASLFLVPLPVEERLSPYGCSCCE